METEQVCSLENYLDFPDNTADEKILAARKTLGDSLVILGHHYQRDEVIKFADFTGDSFKLAKDGAATKAKYIIYCGVHFMAESADILGHNQIVILPDLNAGCSMADMAEISQVEACWETLEKVGIANDLIPITYMNSTAAIKAFVGEHGGLVCTSSNAQKAFDWGFSRGKRILFLPDQHLGRNTGYNMNIPLDEMIVYDPWALQGGQSKIDYEHSKIILWKGHCAVHQRFLPNQIDEMRNKYPGIKVIVHPECRWDVCQKADAVGSTEQLIKIVDASPIGTTFAIGTEIHLVNRLAKKYASLGKKIYNLTEQGCLCTTMYRITPQHLGWALENLVAGHVVNQISVSPKVKTWATVALDRMLELK
jgi:quinolinate synthase